MKVFYKAKHESIQKFTELCVGFGFVYEKLKQLRKEKGKTLKEVASEIGVTLSAYSNYEQGIREPSYDILKKICSYYEVTSDYLLGLGDWYGK